MGKEWKPEQVVCTIELANTKGLMASGQLKGKLSDTVAFFPRGRKANRNSEDKKKNSRGISLFVPNLN